MGVALIQNSLARKGRAFPHIRRQSRDYFVALVSAHGFDHGFGL
jgi:hypothetical protein